MGSWSYSEESDSECWVLRWNFVTPAEYRLNTSGNLLFSWVFCRSMLRDCRMCWQCRQYA